VTGCKAQQGWIETISETEDCQITLRDVKTACKTHRLWTNGDLTGQEYFLIENRQLTGFDKYLPCGGLLIWHIDDDVWSNTDESHPKVKLMQADGLAQLKGNWGRGDAGDVWPGFSSKSTFGTVSNPNSKAYSGLDTYISITNIPASSPCMTFDVKVQRSDQAPTGNFNPRIWYRLHNHHHSATPSLDVINDNGTDSRGHIEMRREGDYSGQYWQIKSNRDGTYALRTMFLGPDRQLDVYSHDNSTPVLQKFAHVTGQHWQIKPWGDGTWHLENAYTGQFQYLDTVDGKYDVKMRAADATRPTQRWTITPVRPIGEPGF
jgi:immune inhibitor A